MGHIDKEYVKVESLIRLNISNFCLLRIYVTAYLKYETFVKIQLNLHIFSSIPTYNDCL